MPRAMRAAFDPTVPRAEDDDVRGRNAGDSAEEHAPAAEGLFEVLGAFLRRHPAGDLAHGPQEGQKAFLGLDRLISYGDDLSLKQGEREASEAARWR